MAKVDYLTIYIQTTIHPTKNSPKRQTQTAHIFWVVPLLSNSGNQGLAWDPRYYKFHNLVATITGKGATRILKCESHVQFSDIKCYTCIVSQWEGGNGPNHFSPVKKCVGDFNSSEKYQSNWIISPSRGKETRNHHLEFQLLTNLHPTIYFRNKHLEN